MPEHWIDVLVDTKLWIPGDKFEELGYHRINLYFVYDVLARR